MTSSIEKELLLPHQPEDVWRALTDRGTIAKWMYPNDFEARVGARFTLKPPSNPKADFDGTVRCEVLECTAPTVLVYSWEGGPVVGTRVRYQLEADGDGTRVDFEHSRFDLAQPWGANALNGAEYGWNMMLEKLADVLAGETSDR